MHVAIVHFHLQTGGVTRVIQNACAALAAGGHRVVVLSGEPAQQPLAANTAVRIIPALAYEERREASSPNHLRKTLQRAARVALGADPDLWHVHNHSLGKNLVLPEALLALANEGHRLLLQPHDYAEDGRPALYRRMLQRIGSQDGARLAARLYPLATQIHYAALSSRDQTFLAAAGIPPQRLHRLPNAVSLAGEPPAAAAAAAAPEAAQGRRWLYPTRAIRRKNLGELLLWAALAVPGTTFATTQAPQNPAEQPRYRRWVALARELELPVQFELGARGTHFGALLASSHALMTTSVAEGFGLAFLEPWLLGRPLAGRDLPEITSDFTADGIDLGGLYRRLPVPLGWLDADALRRRLDTALQATANAYSRPRAADDLQRAWAVAVDADAQIDFGRLDEIAQEQVLRRVVADPAARSAFVTTEPTAEPGASRIAANRRIVERNYLIDGYRQRLEAIYRALLAEPIEPVRDHADGDRLLERFQAPERLHLLRT